MTVPVTVWKVAPQQFQSRVNALGTLRAWESVVITSSVSETVASLHFEDGEHAEQGKLLNEVSALVDAGRIRSTATAVAGRIDAATLRRVHAEIESGSARGKIVLEGF